MKGYFLRRILKNWKSRGWLSSAFLESTLLASVSTDITVWLRIHYIKWPLYFCFSNTNKCLYVLHMMQNCKLSVLGSKKCSFFGKFGVLCFLETIVLRFALLPYYWQNKWLNIRGRGRKDQYINICEKENRKKNSSKKRIPDFPQ